MLWLRDTRVRGCVGSLQIATSREHALEIDVGLQVVVAGTAVKVHCSCRVVLWYQAVHLHMYEHGY